MRAANLPLSMYGVICLAPLAKQRLPRNGFLVSFLFLVSSLFISFAQANDESSPRDSFRYSTDKSWYDYSKDELIYPRAKELEAPAKAIADRHQKIVLKTVIPPAPPSSFWGYWDSFVLFIQSLYASNVFLFISVITLGGLIAFLVYSMAKYLHDGSVIGRRRTSMAVDNQARDQARIVDLPFQIQGLQTDLWSEAIRLGNAGEYSKGMVYLFGHALVELDAAGCIKLQRGKTNRRYLREVKRLQAPEHSKLLAEHLADFLDKLINRFEAVFFGREEIDRQQFEQTVSSIIKMKAIIVQRKELVPTEEKLTEPTLVIRGLLFVLSCLTVASSGCNTDRLYTEERYGEASTAGAKRCVAGLSVFRSLCEKNKQTSIHLRSLSPRSHQLDTIVWAPKTFRVPTPAEVDWFEAWLSTGDRKTLIFIGRDFSPLARYWQSAIEHASEEDRSTFLHQKALAETDYESLRCRSDDEASCDWFKIVVDQSRLSDATLVHGEHASRLESGKYNLPVRGYCDSIEDTDENSSQKDTSVQESKSLVFRKLLASADGRPIVLSVESSRWPGGKVLVWSNGSMLLNEGMIYPSHRQYAQEIIATFPANGRIGFLSPEGEIPIRSEEDDSQASGFELLRVWPLSLISMQALFTGFFLLLALFPIFGRPRRLPTKSTTDFGLHIEALGELLHRSRDKRYALQRIANYFRDVRQEPNSVWSNVAPPLKELPTLKESPNE